MASLLVLGGSGYVGKSVLSAYQRGLLKPWAIDSLKIVARNASQLKITHPQLLRVSGVELYDLDITTCNSLPRADLVINAAASADLSSYNTSAEHLTNNNGRATENYLELARQWHRNSKVTLVSSGAVYGALPSTLIAVPETYVSVQAEAKSTPKGLYSAVKLKAEHTTRKLGDAGINVSIARCFSFVGEFLPRDGAFAVGNFINNGLNGQPISVLAAHPVFRSYLHSDDLVCWLLTIVSNSHQSCPVYNVGARQAIEVRDLARRIASYFNQTVYSPSSAVGTIDRYIPDITLAERELGLRVTISLDEALNQTIQAIRTTRLIK